jgi:hypothetical protein
MADCAIPEQALATITIAGTRGHGQAKAKAKGGDKDNLLGILHRAASARFPFLPTQA